MGHGYYHCGPGGFVRRYSTRDERIEWLKDYEAQLETEIKAVKERIQDLQSE